MKRILIASAVLLFGGVGVAAADLGGGMKGGASSYQDVSAPVNFSGVYVGAVGGMELMNTTIGVTGAPIELSGIGSDGWVGELQIGYDWQPRGSRAGVGVFAGANVSNAETTLTYRTVDASYGRDWSWLVGARAFVSVSNNTMAYVGGGFTQADFSLDVGSAEIGTATLSGYFGEAGIETKLTDNVFAKLSGRYTSYDKLDVGGIYVEPESLQVLAGVTFKFRGRLTLGVCELPLEGPDTDTERMVSGLHLG